MNCRKNVKHLDTTEKDAFVAAVLALKNSAPSELSDDQYALMLDRVEDILGTDVRDGIVRPTNRYDDYVLLHVCVAGTAGAHLMPAFLPWHRRYLELMEADLQAVSGDPTLTIPYWDWSDAASSPFTADFLGGDGDGADDEVTTGPFAHATGDWTQHILIGDEDDATGDRSPYLRRNLGGGAASLSSAELIRETLEVTPYDQAPWFAGSNAPDYDDNDSFRNRLEGWFRRDASPGVSAIEPPQLHNLGHVWTGGSMLPATSPNDPVFFLNHAMVDMLWAVWQQKHPTEAYQPADGTPDFFSNLSLDGHRESDDMAMFEGGDTFSASASPSSVLDWRNPAAPATSYGYDTDLPVVTLSTPSVDFGSVPAGSTTYRPVQFTLESCRSVRFRVTAVGGAGFSDPSTAVTTVPATDASGPVGVDVYVAFEAPDPAGGPHAGSATIECVIQDDEGYHVAPDDPSYPDHVVESWTIDLAASPVARERAAVAMVLDRSGSMSLSGGGSSSRFELLENAVAVCADLMLETDGLGLVYYDHAVDRAFDVLPMTPASGQAEVVDALNDPALEPAGGSTAIGAGMIEGADVLTDELGSAGTPYDRFAMLVLTDGNENVAPYVGSSSVASAIAPFADQVYAIGLGQAGDVSDTTLGALANYMLITGAMTEQEQLFRLTKYFIQVLAGITNTQIVVDPDGLLHRDSRHRIPFDIAEADLAFDVIALSPYAPLLDLRLETPDGSVLDVSALGPNVSLHVNRNDAFYRVKLPALPGNPGGSHAGRWHLHLRVARRKPTELRRSHVEDGAHRLDRDGRASLPYSVVVQSRSDIALGVEVLQDSQLAGGTLDLQAALDQYGVPLAGRADVRVEVTDPTRAVSVVRLAETAPGRFSGQLRTTASGVYRCRVLARGTSLGGHRFTREETRTAAVYRRLPEGPRPADADDRGEGELCRLLRCVLQEESVQRTLRRHEIDGGALLECLAKHCDEPAPRDPPAAPTRTDARRLPATTKQVITGGGEQPLPVKGAGLALWLAGAADDEADRPTDTTATCGGADRPEAPRMLSRLPRRERGEKA